MGKKGKGGGLMAGGKGELKAMMALGIEVGRGGLEDDGGGSWPATSLAMGGERLEEEAVELYMKEVLAGGMLDMDGFHGGMGGGEEVWPPLKAAASGIGAGKSPEGMKTSGRTLRSGRTCCVPAVGGGGMHGLVNSTMQRVGEGCSSSAPVVAGGSTYGGGKMAGKSLLGVAPAAYVLGGGPAGFGHGMAGIGFEKKEGYWEEVPGGCEVKSGDMCTGKMWVVDGKMMASRRWVEGGGDSWNVTEEGDCCGRVKECVGGKVLARGSGAAAGRVAARVAGVAGKEVVVAGRGRPVAMVAGRQGEAGGGEGVLGSKVVAGNVAVVGEGEVAGRLVAGKSGVAGRLVAAGGGSGDSSVGGGSGDSTELRDAPDKGPSPRGPLRGRGR